jgi:hypothetical protein
MATSLPGMIFARSISFDTVTNSMDKFLYQPEKIDKGTVYHYVKSNINGSKPCDVFVFIQSEDLIEVFKIYPGTGATYYVTAEFDWDRFSPRVLKGYEIDCEMKRNILFPSGTTRFTILTSILPALIFRSGTWWNRNASLK